MEDLKLSELANSAQREFRSAFGEAFQVTSCEVLGEAYYRGGFWLVLSDGSSKCEVKYGDLELEVTVNGKELFGPSVHEGFAGNMFSREHLKKCLPAIAASASSALFHAPG